MSSDGRLLSRSTTDSGVNYVQSRSSSRAKKERRKNKKRSSSRRNLNDSSASLSMDNSNPNSFMDASSPELNGGSTARSSSFYNKSSTSVFANSKYVRPPKPSPQEEQAGLLSSSMADPNDPLVGHENFQDEFEDEMDEIEMNATTVNLGAMEAKAKSSKRRRRCGTKVCYLLMVLAIVGTILVIVLTQFVGGEKKEPQSVPEPTKMLGLWCHEQLDLGPGQAATFPLQATKDCQDVCNKADCCWDPKSKHYCTAETEKFCEDYRRDCAIMLNELPEAKEVTTEAPVPEAGLEEAVVPTPPATLKTICAPEGPSMTATKVCYDLCERADCCWNQTSTVQCTADSWQANCQPYEEYCSFFNEHPPGSHTTSNNNNNNAGSAGEEDKLPFPYATSELATFCAVENLKDNGPDDCVNECQKAECCWKVGTVNCASTVPNGMCKDYTSHCAVLNSLEAVNNNGASSSSSNTGSTPSDASSNTPTSSIPAAPSGLEVYCDPSEMAEISLHICENKCAAAACCWSTNADSCDSSVSPDVCNPYVQACSILNDLASYSGPGKESQPPAAAADGIDDTVPAPPSDFTTRCSRNSILASSNGGDVLIECERDCLAASCCWQPGADQCADNARCPTYKEHCSLFTGLFQNKPAGSNTDTSSGSDTSSTPIASGSSSSGSNVPPAPADLGTTCASSNLSTKVNSGAGIVQCEKRCLPAACCWKPNHSTDCTGDSQCSAYMEPCGNNLIQALVALEQGTSIAQTTGTHNAEAKKAVGDACNNQQAVFSKANCENICRPGNCCFDESVACPTSVDCSVYDPCGVLFRRNLLRHA